MNDFVYSYLVKVYFDTDAAMNNGAVIHGMQIKQIRRQKR